MFFVYYTQTLNYNILLSFFKIFYSHYASEYVFGFTLLWSKYCVKQSVGGGREKPDMRTLTAHVCK